MSEKRNRHHKAVLDSKDIEAIKAEQKTLKEDYEQHLNKHKETLNQLHESEKSILSNHRDELKEIMRGGERLALLQSLGLGDYSFRAPVGCGWRRGIFLCKGKVHISHLPFTALIKPVLSSLSPENQQYLT